ncbi:MAG: hypothetical protein M0P22_06775, partial [Methanoculleus sp.]|nr:hypothetical protein [Methanoculleus sp.]
GSGEALFWLSFFPDEIGAGPGLKFDLFLLKHVLMPWTVVTIAMGGLTGRGVLVVEADGDVYRDIVTG